MERTPTHKTPTTFTFENKTITVEKISRLFRVTCQKNTGWKIVKILGKRKAAWFILRCTKKKTKKKLAEKITLGKITTLLANENYKMNGAEWISLSMAHGTRPIILKAPKLFRGRVVHIEPSPSGDRTFNLRIIDPATEHRTEPIQITQEQADQTIQALNHLSEEPYEEHHGR